MEDDHELDKVDVSILVGVVDPEHMLLHLGYILLGQGLRYHLTEVLLVQLPVGMF